MLEQFKRQSLETQGIIFMILSQFFFAANDGFVKYIKDTSKCKKDSEGNILSYVGHIQDITEIKLKEREIIDSRERLRTAAELAKLGYWEYFVDTQ